jgi:hypothetical protein
VTGASADGRETETELKQLRARVEAIEKKLK